MEYRSCNVPHPARISQKTKHKNCKQLKMTFFLAKVSRQIYVYVLHDCLTKWKHVISTPSPGKPSMSSPLSVQLTCTTIRELRSSGSNIMWFKSHSFHMQNIYECYLPKKTLCIFQTMDFLSIHIV